VIEILSPSTKSRDERLKRDLYERVGVQEYWLVDPLREVILVHSGESQRFTGPKQYERADLLTTRLLPGLQLPVGKVLGVSRPIMAVAGAGDARPTCGLEGTFRHSAGTA
jgi:Uma2 family endonuclease